MRAGKEPARPDTQLQGRESARHSPRNSPSVAEAPRFGYLLSCPKHRGFLRLREEWKVSHWLSSSSFSEDSLHINRSLTAAACSPPGQQGLLRAPRHSGTRPPAPIPPEEQQTAHAAQRPCISKYSHCGSLDRQGLVSLASALFLLQCFALH